MKKKLTVSEAERFAKKKMFGRFKSSADKEFYIGHSQMVAEAAVILASRKNNVDKELLQVAGWLHDIGYIINKDEHAIHSIELLEKEGYAVSEKLRDCILNHSRTKFPKTKEGKIIQMADKVSVLRPELLKLFLGSNKKDKTGLIENFRKTTSRAIDMLEYYR